MLNCSYILSSVLTKNEFIICSLVALALISWVLFTSARDRLEHVLIGVIVGGAFLNILERVVFGCVSDYFNFFNLFHFNVWDLAITVGVLTLVIKIAIKPAMPKK